jgi:arylsulfatase A-like enzyme
MRPVESERAPLCVALLFVSLTSLLGCERAAAPRPPLVLLISVDTLRRDALRAFDPAAPPLPHLDAFAAESARFERTASVASWTLPAHASMLTGLYPDRHGATAPSVGLASEVATLAERFEAGGYETIALTHGGYLDRKYGMDRGFARYSTTPPKTESADDALRGIFDEAAALLAARSDERPLFLFLQTYAVHDYFRLQPWAVESLKAKPQRPAPEYAECLQGMRRCDAEEWQLLRDLYAAELRTLDASFGRMRSALEAAGLWSTAVLLLTSDHGEGFEPERHRIHHGGRLHEDQIRIPMLVHGPGIAARSLAAPVSLIDVAPTLLELAGQGAPPGLDGRSLAPLLRGAPEPDPGPALFAVEHHSSWWGDTRTKAASLRSRPLAVAVIEGDRWYLRSPRGEEVYDLESDPRQERDQSAERSDLDALRALAARRDVDRAESPRVETSAELVERLRALGYAE